MNQSLKAILQLIAIISVIGAPLIWLGPSNEEVVLLFRFIFPIAAVTTIALLIWAAKRKDKAPDFLSHLDPRYFEHEGFCFSMNIEVVDSVCLLRVYFQNRYERPCTVKIQIWVEAIDHSARQRLDMEIACGPAAFGRRRGPWTIPVSLQGKRVEFQLSVDTTYPEGRGALLRYREGLRVGTTTKKLSDHLLLLAMAIGGHVVLERSARIELDLPSELTGNSADFEKTTETIWQLGDPMPVEPARL